MKKDIEFLLGRIFLSSIFIFSMVGHISDFSGIQIYMMKYGMPAPFFLLVMSLTLRLLGTASILLGYRTSWGVALLTLFLLPTTLVFHTHFGQIMDAVAFFENLSLMGGLLLLSAAGAGRFSVDHFRFKNVLFTKIVALRRNWHNFCS